MTSVPPPEDVKPWYLRNLTQALALNSDTGNVYVRSLRDESVFTNYKGNVAVRVDDDTVQHTSRNRRKVSTNEQIFFNAFQYTKDEQIWDEAVTGTASSTFNEYEGGVVLEVGGDAGDEIIRQTRNVIQYVPGRANEAIFALRLDPFETGVRKRFGIFDETNGVYFEKGVDDYYVVLRKDTPTGIEEQRVPRAEWNVDRLDGTGPSLESFQEDKIQMFTIEYEWFGAGVVEFKIILDNNALPLHRFVAGNNDEIPWANSPYRPLRFELTNVEGVAGTHQILQGSSSVSSEGEVGPLGREQNVATPFDGITTGSADELRPVLSIRLRSDRLNGVVIPLEFQAATLDNTGLFYRVIRDTTLTGASWQNSSPASFAEFDYSATDFTGGDILQTGYISPNTQGEIQKFLKETILQLGRNNMGTTPQTFTILAATVSSNKDVFASLSWVEIR